MDSLLRHQAHICIARDTQCMHVLGCGKTSLAGRAVDALENAARPASYTNECAQRMSAHRHAPVSPAEGQIGCMAETALDVID